MIEYWVTQKLEATRTKHFKEISCYFSEIQGDLICKSPSSSLLSDKIEICAEPTLPEITVDGSDTSTVALEGPKPE